MSMKGIGMERIKRREESPLGTVPNPDPTLRTIDVVDKAIESLFEKLEPRFQAIHMRFEEMDKATKLLHDDYVRVPTVVDRAVLNLRELMMSEITGKFLVAEVKIQSIVTTLGGMDKALVLLQTYNDKMPDFVRNEVKQLKNVHDEKIDGAVDVVNERIKSLADVTVQQFGSINDKFAEKDRAVTVGLTAQKESTNKMEANFTALLTQGRELLAEVRKSTEQQLYDLKSSLIALGSRLDRGEGRASIADPSTTAQLQQLTVAMQSLATSRDAGKGQSAGIGIAVAAVLGFFTIMSSVVSVATILMTRPTPPTVNERIVVSPPSTTTNNK